MSLARLLFVGGWGHHYLRAHVDETSRESLAVAFAGDGHDEMARLQHSSVPGATWYDDAAAALDEFRPDAVSIGGVYGHNGHWLLEAARRGIPAVCDKPVVASWEQLDELERVAAERDVTVLTELPLRCDAAVRAARAVVAHGRIGDPVLATAQKSYKLGAFRPDWYADRDLYTGTVLWIATHGLDLVGFVTGLRAEAVAGRVGNVAHPERGSMEDHTVTVLALANGGSAVVHADYLRPEAAPTHGDDRIRVAGSTGVVEVRDGRCLLLGPEGGPLDVTDDAESVPVHRALLDALTGPSTDYTTAESLALARLGLAARDVGDGVTPPAR